MKKQPVFGFILLILAIGLISPYSINARFLSIQNSSSITRVSIPQDKASEHLKQGTDDSAKTQFQASLITYPRVTCGYASPAGSLTINWKDLPRNISFFNTALYQKQFLPKLLWLHQNGVNLSIGIEWRVDQLSKPNPLDFYYNSTFRNAVFSYFEEIFNTMPEEIISEIIVGDEEPNNPYQWFAFDSDTWPEEIAKYNETYHAGTGFWFKNINTMNATERQTWQQWMEIRNSFAYNSMYDYLKMLYPDKKVIIAFLENYHLGFNPANISTDERSGYQFYTRDPRKVYAAVRYAKTSYPGASVSSTLWGVEKYGFYEDYSLTDFKRLAYAAYLAGADKINWFALGEDERGRGLYNWQRIDPKGKEIFDYINSLNRELMQLPVFRPNPKILEIADYDTSGNSEGIGFVEWDNTNQIRASSADFNLSKYDLILLNNQHDLLSELVDKINSYIANGGHLIVAGNTASTLQDPYGQSRPALVYEEAISDYSYFDNPFNISLDGNNDLGIYSQVSMVVFFVQLVGTKGKENEQQKNVGFI